MKEENKIVYIRQDDRQYINKRDKVQRVISKILLRVRYEIIENGIIIIIPKYKTYNEFICKAITKKIIGIVKDLSNYVFAFDNKLEFLENRYNGIEILKGKTLMKELSVDILENIFKQNNQIMSLENIYIFVNEYSKNNVYLINKMVHYFKTVNIITENLKYYRRLENNLYNQGILITVSNNKRKSVVNAKYIINIDFEKEKIINYKINNYAVILNCTKEKNTFEKSFRGIVINNVNLNIEEDSKEYIREFYGSIDNNIFIESVLVSDKQQNGKIDYLKNEYNIKIYELFGIRGKISTQEIKEL